MNETLIFNTMYPDGNDSATKFEYIYNSYVKQMLYVSNRILGNYQDAEDATQEALLRISSNIDRISTDDDTRTRRYVLTAAKNAAKDILKRRSSRAETVDIESVFDVNEDDSSIKVIENSGYEDILDSIRKLDPIYRDVLYYYLVEEMSEKEIAKLIGRNYSTVKMQIKRGRSILAQKLMKGGENHEKY